MHSTVKSFYHCQTSTLKLILSDSSNGFNKSSNYMCNPSQNS